MGQYVVWLNPLIGWLVCISNANIKYTHPEGVQESKYARIYTEVNYHISELSL